MGVPTSEDSYTSATTRRETMKSMMDMWWHGKTTKYTQNSYSKLHEPESLENMSMTNAVMLNSKPVSQLVSKFCNIVCSTSVSYFPNLNI
jgi:hypothetical protein